MDSGQHDPNVGGWLLVLCGCLGIWQPLTLAFVAASTLSALAARGWPAALLLLLRILATAWGVAAAIAILRRHGGAVRLTQAALLFWVVVELSVYSTSFFPNNRPPGDTPLYVVATLVYYAAWAVYLSRSARVRRTLA